MHSLGLRLRSLFGLPRSKKARRKSSSHTTCSSVTAVEQLENRRLLTVTYHGGALLAQVEAQNVFLGDQWTSNTTLKNEAPQLNAYISTLVSGAYMDMLTNAGYGVSRGTSSTGANDAIKLNTSRGIQDSQIQAELQKLINSKTVQQPDANRLYIVFVEPNVAVFESDGSSSVTDFLGIHGVFAGKTATGTSVDIHYATLPYPEGPNPTPQSQGFTSVFNELTVVTSHEVAESVTDPNVNYKTIGWYDDVNNGEIGDLTDLTAQLNGYQVQQVVNQSDNPINPNNVQAPRNPSITATSSTSAKLTWKPVIGSNGYHIYQVQGSKTVLLATLLSSTTSYTVTTLSAGSSDTFRIQAYNSVSTANTANLSVTLPKAASVAVVFAVRPATLVASSNDDLSNLDFDQEHH